MSFFFLLFACTSFLSSLHSRQRIYSLYINIPKLLDLFFTDLFFYALDTFTVMITMFTPTPTPTPMPKGPTCSSCFTYSCFMFQYFTYFWFCLFFYPQVSFLIFEIHQTHRFQIICMQFTALLTTYFEGFIISASHCIICITGTFLFLHYNRRIFRAFTIT